MEGRRLYWHLCWMNKWRDGGRTGGAWLERWRRGWTAWGVLTWRSLTTLPGPQVPWQHLKRLSSVTLDPQWVGNGWSSWWESNWGGAERVGLPTTSPGLKAEVPKCHGG